MHPEEPESSFVRFAVQSVKGEGKLADVAPQRGLVSTEVVKCEVGRSGKSQIATR